MIWVGRVHRLKQVAVFSLAFIVLNVLVLKYMAQDMENVDLNCLRDHCIAIDPGHGGIDSGATGNGKVEKDINLAIASKLSSLLQSYGCNVVMTREGDVDYYKRGGGGKKHDLLTRVDIINHANANLFVSIHVNSFKGAAGSFGAQVFYNPKLEENKKLAEIMQQSLSLAQKGNKRQIKQDLNILLLKGTTIPGVLIETGFISNQKDAELLTDETYQQKMAESIARALAYHVSQNVGR